MAAGPLSIGKIAKSKEKLRGVFVHNDVKMTMRSSQTRPIKIVLDKV